MSKNLLSELQGDFLMYKESSSMYIALALQYMLGQKIELDPAKLDLTFVSARGPVVKSINPDSWANSPDEILNTVKEDSVMIVPVQGAITKYDVCGWFGAQTYAQLISKASTHKKVKSIVLLADSPGGSADGSLDFAQAVRTASQVKPVISFVDGMCCSAMYRIAAHSSYIIAKPGSIIGSIGTMISFKDFTAFYESRGIKEHNINAAGSPDKNKDAEEAKKGNYELIRESVLNPLNDLFLSEMKAERNLPDEVLTGKVYDPIKALSFKMIDDIGSLEDAISLALSGKQPVKNQNLSSQIKNENDMPGLKIGASIMALLGLSQQTDTLTQDQIDQLEALAGSNIKLTGDLQTANSRMASLETELANEKAAHEQTKANLKTAQDQAAAYGSQPGATATKTPGANSSTQPDLSALEEEAQQIVKRYLPK